MKKTNQTKTVIALLAMAYTATLSASAHANNTSGVPIPPEMTGLPIGTAPADRIRLASTVTRVGVVQHAVHDDMKLHYNWTDGELRYFDRAVDPQETNDILDLYDPKVIELYCAIEDMAGQISVLIPEAPTRPTGLVCPTTTSPTGTGTGSTTP